MWLHNRVHEIEVQAYNMGEVTRGDGGIVYKSKPDPIDLNVCWIPPKKRYRSTNTGTNILEEVKFQVSERELEDKDFEIIEGRTHIVKDGLEYKVFNVLDSFYMNQVQLKECMARRKISMRDVL